MSDGLTRRDLLRTGAAAGIGAAASGLALDPVIERALAHTQRAGRLSDIEHVVILIQENRSFDHYFGTYPGVRGFADRHGRSAFTQRGYTKPGHGGRLLPFHLDTHGQPQCTQDITHEWGAQHRSWDHGRMDRFVKEHLASDRDGALTMGYYRRHDIDFYYRLADAFTICDRYHCSVMGPTDPNRLYTMSATIDPAGRHGGPLLETLVAKRAANAGKFRWTTMPEQLSARRVSWKVYTSPEGGSLDNVLTYFRNFQHKRALSGRGIKPTYPADFAADLEAGRLPQVSWILGSLVASEHPGFSSAKAGEKITRDVLSALTSHPEVWKKTALFVTWDEKWLLRPRRAAGPAARDSRRVPHRPLPSRGRPGHSGTDRPRLPGPHDRRLALRTRWVCVLRRLRPHLRTTLPRDAVRCRGAQPESVAALGDRGSDQRLQLRPARQVGASVPARRRPRGRHRSELRLGALPGAGQPHAGSRARAT